MLILPENINTTQIYKLLIGSVTPRPIAWVSSISTDGIANLAPFSFFTVASVNPPIICFNPLHTNNGREKDTLTNIREQKEFVVNTVSYSHLDLMSKTSHDVASDINEFDYAKIERVSSEKVKPFRVANAIVSFECKLNQIIDLGKEAMSGHLVLGDIVAVHIQDEAIDDFRIDNNKLDAIGRMAGSDYSLTRDRIQLDRK